MINNSRDNSHTSGQSGLSDTSGHETDEPDLVPISSLLYSILPSYQMHQAIVAKSLEFSPDSSQQVPQYDESQVPRDHDLHDRLEGLNLSSADPYFQSREPQSSNYLYAPSNASTNLQSFFSSVPENASSHDESHEVGPTISNFSMITSQGNGDDSGFSYVTPESGNSILNFHHNIRQTSSLPYHAIDMSIHFTSDAAIPGTIPNLIHSETAKYHTNGDHIQGFVVCENTTKEPIPFSMFYVLFEGNTYLSKNIFTKTRNKAASTKNFLQSVDLCASSNYSESRNVLQYDPIDDTYLVFNEDRILYPGIKYKRYFSFQVPHNLLDYYCEKEGLMRQSELPPSVDSVNSDNMTFFNATIEYSLEAKFVGKDFETNSYVVLKDISRNIEIIPRSLDIATTLQYREEVKGIDLQLRERAKDAIKLGKQIRNLIPSEDNSKRENYNYNSGDSTPPPPYYEPNMSSSPIHCLTIPISRKTFNRTSKKSGVLEISVSTSHHEIKYIPSVSYRDTEISAHDLASWTINIPIHMKYIPMSNDKLPEITNVTATLETFSYISDKYKYPIEIDFDMLFNNDTGENFESLVSEPYRKYYKEILEQLQHTQGNPDYAVDNKLIENLKAILSCRTKTVAFDIHNCKMMNTTKLNSSAIPWTEDHLNGTQDKNVVLHIDLSKTPTVSKTLNISAVLTSAQIRGSMSAYTSTPSFDKYNIVPSFQNCFMGRIYYVQLKLEILNGNITTTKIPITIVH